jgi:glucokinase
MNPTQSYPRLLGDIGGTNARFALQLTAHSGLTHPQALACKNYEEPMHAIHDYLQANNLPQPIWAAIGVATDTSNDQIQMTNNHWAFSKIVLQEKLGLEYLEVLNDFTSLALAIPTLDKSLLMKIGGGNSDPTKPCGLIGAGTGLGVSGLIVDANKYIPLSGEGGHATLAAFNADEYELISILQRQFGHVSAERILSGPGIENLHRAILLQAGLQLDDPRFQRKAAEIAAAGLKGICPYARKTLEVFCNMFGTVAADLALTLGANGGIFIGGGVIPKLGSFFAESGFRQRFEDKGRFSKYLGGIATWVIDDKSWPGLIGAANSLDQHYRLMTM